MSEQDYLRSATGVVVLGASQIKLTDDPEYPVIYVNQNGDEIKLHKSRIIHLADTQLIQIDATND